jgi:hypothetical protein
MFRVVLGEMVHLCQMRHQLEQRAETHLKDNADFNVRSNMSYYILIAEESNCLRMERKSAAIQQSLPKRPKIMNISNFWPLQTPAQEPLLSVFCGTSVGVLVPDLYAAVQRRAPED